VISTDSRAAAPKDTTGARTVEQRIAVRWPGLAHLTTASVLRLPRGSRLRRAMLERSARAGYEAWNRDDLEPARAYADPEIEVHVVRGSDSPVGFDDVYHGPDGYCRMMEEWSAAWRSWRIELEDVLEVAPNKILLAGHHIGVGLASGAEVEHWAATLYTFRRGKILRVDAFFSADKENVSEAVSSIVAGDLGPVAGAAARR